LRLGTVRFRADRGITQIAYSPDGKFLVTGVEGNALQVWGAHDGTKLRRLDTGIEYSQGFDFSPDAKTIAVVGFQFDPKKRLIVNRVHVIDFATGRVVTRGEWTEQGGVGGVAFSPDGKMLATGSEGGFRLWNAATCDQLVEIPLNRSVTPAISFSPDPASRKFAVIDDQSVSLWDVTTKKEVRRLGTEPATAIDRFTFSPNGSRLASAGDYLGEICVWRVDDGQLLRRFKSQALKSRASHISGLAFAPDGTALAATLQSGNLVLWDLKSGRESQPFPACALAGHALAFSPDGATIATSGGDRVLHLWDRATGKDRLETPDAHDDIVGALLFIDGGKTLVSGSDDRTVRIWDLAESHQHALRQRMVLRHEGWVRTMAVSADERMLATGTSYPGENSIYLWDLATGKKRRVISSPDARIYPIAVQVSSGGEVVTAGWSDGSVRSWDIATGEAKRHIEPEVAEVTRRRGPGNFAHSGFLAADGKKLSTIGKAGVRVTDLVKTPRAITSRPGNALAVALDGKSVAIAARGRPAEIKLADGRIRHDATQADSTISWVDSDSGQVRREFVVPESFVESLAFSPDGQLLAAATFRHRERGVIYIYRLKDKKEVQTIETPCLPSMGLAFTPDGKRLVVAMADTTILFWDLKNVGN
jgi:WD40 repeat protein